MPIRGIEDGDGPVTTMQDVLRIGVIGLRRGAGLARMCQAMGGARVTALHDIDSDRTLAVAGEIGAIAYRDFPAFLAAPLDLVVVASPMPFHAEQIVAALEAGHDVVSEVLPCRTPDEAERIVRAARRNHRRFFVAENCVFYDEIELLRRLHAAGRFGDLYYAEGDYIHDCEGLWFDPEGQRTWRGRGELGVYGSHGIGPLLAITDDRVREVRCTALPAGIVNPELDFPTMHLLEMTTVAGRVFRSRIDVLSPRPHPSTTVFRLQGTAGSFESDGTGARIWLKDAHEPSRHDGSAAWHDVESLLAEYLPDRQQAVPLPGGHGNSEFWLLSSVLHTIRTGDDCLIERDRGMDMILPCLVAEQAARSGESVIVPDPRLWTG